MLCLAAPAPGEFDDAARAWLEREIQRWESSAIRLDRCAVTVSTEDHDLPPPEVVRARRAYLAEHPDDQHAANDVRNWTAIERAEAITTETLWTFEGSWRASKSLHPGLGLGTDGFDSASAGALVWVRHGSSLVVASRGQLPERYDPSNFDPPSRNAALSVLMSGGLSLLSSSGLRVVRMEAGPGSWQAECTGTGRDGEPFVLHAQGTWQAGDTLERGLVRELRTRFRREGRDVEWTAQASGWLFDPCMSDWIATRVVSGPPARPTNTYRFVSSAPVMPDEFKALVAVPEPARPDPFRGQVAIRTITDFRSGAPITRTALADGSWREVTPAPGADRRPTRLRWAGWITAGLFAGGAAWLAIRRWWPL